MKVICAPDKFKESISAPAAAAAMARGVRLALPDAQIDECPIADGGEGTVDALVAATCGRRCTSRVMGPLGAPVDATWGRLGGDGESAAVIEMATAAGLALVPPSSRDPTRTTTFGVGELIAAALDTGARHIIVGIGGSATNDGGCGAAQALGVRFLDASGRVITEPIAGGTLTGIARIDTSARHPALRHVAVTVACDVTNPLTGTQGAAHIYAPQKGATSQQVGQLDASLRHLASLIRRDVGIDVEQLPGAGAAGGLGAGLIAFAGATLKPGAALVLDAVRFDERVRDCDLCLTGEGRLDGQSLSGKACMAVAHAAAKHDVPTIALVGSVGPGAERAVDAGLREIVIIGEGLSRDESMRRASELLERAATHAVRRLH